MAAPPPAAAEGDAGDTDRQNPPPPALGLGFPSPAPHHHAAAAAAMDDDHDDDAGAGEPRLQGSLLQSFDDQVLPPAAAAASSPPPPSSPSAATTPASGGGGGGGGGAAGLGRRLLVSMSLSRTLSFIGLALLPQNSPPEATNLGLGLGLGLLLYPTEPEPEPEPSPTVDHVDAPCPALIDRSPSSVSDAISGFGEQDDGQAPQTCALDTTVQCAQPQPHLIQQEQQIATVAAAQGLQMLLDQNIIPLLKLIDDDLPMAADNMLQVQAWEKPVISQGAADDQRPTNRRAAALEHQGQTVEQRHCLEAAMDGNVSEDQQGILQSQGAIDDGNTAEFQEEVLIEQHVIEQRGESTQDIAGEDQNKAVEQFASDEFKGTMDDYAVGYLEVVEHDVIGQSGETMDGIAVDDQVKEVEHDVIRERSETTDGVAIKDQEQVMEQFATNEPGATKNNNTVEDQELVEQSVVDEWREITYSIAFEDQWKVLQQCIGDESGATENNNTVEDPAVVEQVITDETDETMDEIAVEDQELTVEQCTNDELGGTENDNALEDQVSDQGAIDERSAATDCFSTEDQEVMEQRAGDVSSITKDKDAVEEKVEQDVIEERGESTQDIVGEYQKKAVRQSASNEFSATMDNYAVGYLEVVEHVVIGESGKTTDGIAVDDQMMEVEYDVIHQRSETTGGIAIKDQEQVMEQFASNEPGATKNNINVEHQELVGQSVIDEWGEITYNIAVEDQRKVPQQCISGKLGATENNNAVEDPAMVEQGITDEIGKTMDDIAVGDQETTVEQCTNDELGGTEIDNALEDQVSEQGAIDERCAAMDGFCTEDQEVVEQCAGDVSSIMNDKDAMEEKVEQEVIGKEDIAMKAQEKAVKQCINDKLRTNKNERAVEEHKRVEEQGVIDENVTELCIDYELRVAKDVIAFQDQGKMLEQSIGDEQGETKGKFAVQNNMEMVDHVSHGWGTTEDNLAINMAASVGTNGISSSEDSITLNDSVNGWGAVKEKVKVCVVYPRRPGKLNCPFYVSTGSFSYGLSCNFNHPPLKAKLDVSSFSSEQENYGATEILELNRVGLPIREGARNCSYYMRNGTCSYGKKCHFNHPEQVIDAQFDPPTGWEDDALPSSPLSKKSHDHANPGDTSYLKNSSDRATFADSSYINSSDYATLDDASYFKRSFSHVASDKKSSTSEVLPPNILRILLPPQKVPPSTEENVMKVNKDINWSAASDDSNGCRSADSSGGALCKQDHVNYPERPGRPECPFYTRFGDCKFASACKYHHSKDRFPNRSSAASDNSNGRRSADSSGGAFCKQEHVNYPERPGRPECPFYTRFGDCKFASACKYHHPKDRFPNRSSAASDNSNGRRSADCSGGTLCKQEHVNYPERPGRCHSNDTLQGEELVEFLERPGEPECPFYMKNGYCKFGVECKFHHPKGSTSSRWSPKDVEKPVAPKEHHLATKIKLQDHMCQQDQYPERPGQPDCRYYMQFGKCKYWSACIFHHPTDRLSNGWHPSENVLKQEEQAEHTLYPERPGELECSYYMRHGSCKFQRNCKYHHPKD